MGDLGVQPRAATAPRMNGRPGSLLPAAPPPRRATAAPAQWHPVVLADGEAYDTTAGNSGRAMRACAGAQRSANEPPRNEPDFRYAPRPPRGGPSNRPRSLSWRLRRMVGEWSCRPASLFLVVDPPPTSCPDAVRRRRSVAVSEVEREEGGARGSVHGLEGGITLRTSLSKDHDVSHDGTFSLIHHDRGRHRPCPARMCLATGSKHLGHPRSLAHPYPPLAPGARHQTTMHRFAVSPTL
jgi:hypothetical protein